MVIGHGHFPLSDEPGFGMLAVCGLSFVNCCDTLSRFATMFVLQGLFCYQLGLPPSPPSVRDDCTEPYRPRNSCSDPKCCVLRFKRGSLSSMLVEGSKWTTGRGCLEEATLSTCTGVDVHCYARRGTGASLRSAMDEFV